MKLVAIKGIRNLLLIITGTLSLILGIIGIFIPLLPTTPFLLLSAFCYLRSSKTLYNWLIKHKLLGTYIYNYMTYRSISERAKISAPVSLWISLGISFSLVANFMLKYCYFSLVLELVFI